METDREVFVALKPKSVEWYVRTEDERRERELAKIRKKLSEERKELGIDDENSGVGKLSRPMKETEKLSTFGLCFLLKLFKMQVNRQIMASTDDSRVFKQLGCIDLEKA